LINILYSFLGVRDLPDPTKKLIWKLIASTTVLNFIWFLSAAFFTLFVIDTVGIELLGFLVAISYLIQALFDYPSGTIGDWIGQRWILFTGFFLEAIAYIILFFANSFSTLLIAYVIRAIAASQQSGAVGTWFDNNYKVTADEIDPQRKIYKFFIGRWNTISNIVPGLAAALGGILATTYFREMVFLIQAIGLGVLAIVFLIIIKDFPGIDRPKRSVKNYFILLGDGLRFAFLNKVMLLFLIGLCLSSTVVLIWIDMMLFPVYFSYTGSDSGVGILRLIILLLGTVSVFFASKFAVNTEITKIPHLTFMDTVIFYWGVAVITALYPPTNNFFTPQAILIFILFYAVIYFFHGLKMILEQRFFLDSIPDQNRNSIYSLIPTLLLLASSPMAIIGGQLIKNLGISTTSFLLGSAGLISVLFFYLALRSIPIED
jgi:MFS family permease